jgi:5'-nucleotidase
MGLSEECDNEATETLGGGVCDLVSKAWLEALVDAHNVDLTLNQAGLCRADILEGDVTFESVKNILPSGYQIVLVETTGEHIMDALELAAVAAYEGDPGSYPYGSGIRFKVDYKLTSGFVYDVEVNSGLLEEWDSIIPSQTYLVATNEIMANKIDATNRVVLSYTDIELFMEYAKTVCVLEDPPASEYSTQYFDGLKDLIMTQAAYSCLQDDSLCDCGFC